MTGREGPGELLLGPRVAVAAEPDLAGVELGVGVSRALLSAEGGASSRRPFMARVGFHPDRDHGRAAQLSAGPRGCVSSTCRDGGPHWTPTSALHAVNGMAARACWQSLPSDRGACVRIPTRLFLTS